MKFSTKLILSFTCITVLLLAIGLVSQYLNEEVRERVVAESSEAVEELQLSGEMGLNLYRSLINTQYFLEDRYRKSLNQARSGNELEIQKAEDKVRTSLRNFSENLVQFESIIRRHLDYHEEPGDSIQINLAMLEKLRSRFEIYASLVVELLELARQDYNDGREFFTVTIEPYFRTNILPVVDELRQQTQVNLNREVNTVNAQLDRTGTILGIATVAAFILSLLLVWYLYKSIASPLSDLAMAAQKIGQGNLDERIEVKSKDEIGQLGEEFNRMTENLSRTTVSKNFMDDIIESMAEALIVTDENNRIQRINSATSRMLDYTEEELKGKSFSYILDDETSEVLVGLKPEETFEDFETFYITGEGEAVPVSFSRSVIHGGSGEVRGLVCVASDISQRKEAEKQIRKSLKEKEVLLAEIHHRVKNNLAVISGLLQMQIWETDNEQAEMVLKDSQLRVQSIALIHEKLYQSETLSYIEFDKYIRDLIQAITSTYLDSTFTVDMHTELQSVALNINQAIPCSLLLNELLVNAYKHAFKDRDKGNMLVKFWQEGEKAYLYVKDDGPGFPDGLEAENADSMGMSLINTLSMQLNGDFEMTNFDGASFKLGFKIEEVS